MTYICAKSPGTKGPDGRFYSRDSIILIDELATNVPDQLNAGLQWTVPKLADAIKEMCARWDIRADGAADDAIFSRQGHQGGSITDEFRRCNVYFRPAKKADRRTGWEIMKRMLSDAGKPGVPRLYISRTCGYFSSTVPYLARDPKRTDDVDSRGPDHGTDACRYGLLRERREIKMMKLSGF